MKPPTYDEMETQFLALCADVQMASRKIYGAAGNGHSERAALLALSLCDHAVRCQEGLLMRLERVTGPDLGTLRVDLQNERPE